jgi:hypothetical protein
MDGGTYAHTLQCIELLKHFAQIKRSSEISLDEIILIKDELKLQDPDIIVSDIMVSDIMVSDIHNALRKHGLLKCYDDILLIYRCITCNEIPTITKIEHDIILNMCKLSMKAYAEKIRPSDRFDLLSPSFVLRKVLCLINLYDVALCIDTFHNKKQRDLYETMWRSLCSYLKWQYQCTPKIYTEMGEDPFESF